MADGNRQLSDPSLPWPSDEQILADLGCKDSDDYLTNSLLPEHAKEALRRGEAAELSAEDVAAFRRAVQERYGELAYRLASAPVAVVDTRPGLALCALREEDFPALEALRGKRVALVEVQP